MNPFVHEALPGRVVFGWNTLERLGDEISALGCRRALLLTTTRQGPFARSVMNGLADRGAEVFDGAKMHTPVDVTDHALDVLRRAKADCLIALGGGSTIGLAKALALRTDLPQIAIPTTYAGSEATPILGETKDGRKTTLRSPKVLPETIIYDVALTLTLPPDVSAVSGMNAIAHAVEALYAKDVSPLVIGIATQGIAALSGSLPDIVSQPHGRSARERALFGAWACGVCLGSVGMALHHKLCHTLGGSFNLPHAETHAVILPHVVAFNAAAAPEAIAKLGEALGVADAARGLFELSGKLGAPASLQAIGMREDQLDLAASIATENPYWNPRPVERGVVLALLTAAFFGHQPSDDPSRHGGSHA